VRHDHEVLNRPLQVKHDSGRLKVLKRVEKEQSEMGEALTLDGIVNSIDAEVVAKGTSAKGPERGAIVRHGRYTLWAFAGGVGDMTEAGRALFVNTVFYAAKHKENPVLERRFNQTRDGLFSYIELARHKNAGFIRTLGQYLPVEARGKSIDETEQWIEENRPYLRAEGRVFHIDEFAKKMGIPNHRRSILEQCITNLREQRDVEQSVAELERYAGEKDLGASAEAWQKWYDENRDYLFFSDSEGSRFLIDEQAKAKGIPTEKLRGWSSDEINYRVNPIVAEVTIAEGPTSSDHGGKYLLTVMVLLLAAGGVVLVVALGTGAVWLFKRR